MDQFAMPEPRPSTEAPNEGDGKVGVRNRVPMSLHRPGRQTAEGPTGELVTFTGLADAGEHVAYLVKPWGDTPLVRLHSECLTGDVFGSTRCDCGPQLDEALERIAEAGGIVLYLRQEGRGIGLYNKIDAYRLQDGGADTFEANRILGRGNDERDYRVAAQMLVALGVARIRLLTNNPDKARALTTHGVDVVAVNPTEVFLTPANYGYLSAKVRKAGHRIDLSGAQQADPQRVVTAWSGR
jgi:GTP cyclohydrolase II